MATKKPQSVYQLQVNGSPAKKTFSKNASSTMNTIWTQFNRYAKGKDAIAQGDSTVLGSMVWVLPNGDRLSLAKV